MALILGYYNKRDDKHIRLLFNGMTTAEKVDILSMRFDHMWYRAMMYYPDFTSINTDRITKSNINAYVKKKSKFESSFMVDGGRKLRSMMNDTHNSTLVWEIPKGRKDKDEVTIDCAMREFKEETGIGSQSYMVISSLTPINESYINMGTTYVNKFFIAHTNMQDDVNINFSTNQQPSEIDDIKWMGIQDIKYIDPTGRLTRQVSNILNIFKLYTKKHALFRHASYIKGHI